ncbi:Annexin A13, partial [Entomortierella lignicola]
MSYYPPNQGGYGYPAYPPQQQQQYTAGPPVYPPQAPPAGYGYPPAQGYPPAPGYPSSAPGYPPPTSAYPPTAGYPPAAGYPPPQQQGYGYPGSAPPPVQHAPTMAPPQHAPTMAPPAPMPSYYQQAPGNVPSPQQDAETIHRACKGFGTDEKSVISVVANRTPEHLGMVVSLYKQFYGKDLAEVLAKETSGNFAKTLHYLILPPIVLDAELIHEACVGAGTNER